jgi:hypothetical protein
MYKSSIEKKRIYLTLGLSINNKQQTDVQRIRGESTDERISTDLDYIKTSKVGYEVSNL